METHLRLAPLAIAAVALTACITVVVEDPSPTQEPSPVADPVPVATTAPPATGMETTAPDITEPATATPDPVADRGLRPAAPEPEPPTQPAKADALALWDSNGNGRITCTEAREHGIAPVYSNHPAYPYMTDRDGDGKICE